MSRPKLTLISLDEKLSTVNTFKTDNKCTMFHYICVYIGILKIKLKRTHIKETDIYYRYVSFYYIH